MKALLFFFALVSLVGCGTKDANNKPFRAADYPISLIQTGSTQLGEGTNLVVATQFQSTQNGFTLVDPVVGESAYLFHSDGSLNMKVGGKGQGPGEYVAPTGFTLSQDRLWLADGATQKLHIYDMDGTSLEDIASPVKGLITSLLPQENGGVVIAIFSRYTPQVFHVLNPLGEVERSFLDQPEAFNHALDTFAPAGVVNPTPDGWFQSFNFAYEVNVYDPTWQKTKTLKFASIRYNPPSINKSREAKGQKEELDLRGSFTQFNGLYPFGTGYVSYLVGWKDKNTSVGILEFWDHEFFGRGFYEVEEGERFLGVHKDQLVFFNKDTATFTFRQMAELHN